MSDTDNHTQANSFPTPVNQAQQQPGQPGQQGEQRSHVALNFNAKGLAQPDIKLYFSTPEETLSRGPDLLEALLWELTRRFPTTAGDWQPTLERGTLLEIIYEAHGRTPDWRAE